LSAHRRGRIAVIGAGPAGMATALAGHRTGFDVAIYGHEMTSFSASGEAVVLHLRDSAIRHDGRSGYEWWVLDAFDPSVPFTGDLRAHALGRTRGFTGPLRSLIEQTSEEHLFRWEIRDRTPLKQWSKGRVTIVGDAAHPTSPYAAYGAGMSIEDGQKAIGDDMPAQILSQLAEIDAVEERRSAASAGVPARS